MSSRATIAATIMLASLPLQQPEPEADPLLEIPAMTAAELAALMGYHPRPRPRPMTDEERVHHENATAAHSAKEAARKARRAARNAKGMQSL